VIITFFTAGIKIVLGVLSAYALSLLRFPGRNILFVVILAALMVPNQITIISNFALVAQLGWKNTFQGIIIPLAGVAFGTFLMRNQFLSLPHEIIEAARMDGAGPFKLLWRVVMPLSWPTLVAFSLITIVNEWNEYLWPFLMSDDERTAPLAGRPDDAAEQRRCDQLGPGHGRHRPDHPARAHPLPRSCNAR
jgi:sn-glycerol 3-phosphate transport system permease protein